MATSWPLTVEFDVSEPRVDKDRLVASAGGAPDFTGWDTPISSSSLWIDPITRTVMLAPLCVTSAWNTTTSGNYARLTKASYTLTTASAWVDNNRGVSGNVWLESNGVNEVVRTTATYSANQGFYLNFFVSSIEDLGDTVILECGWGDYEGEDTVWLRVRASGAITIYKGATPVAVYDTQFSISPGTRGGTKSIGRRGIPLLLLPCRRRELLVVSGVSEGFSHAFADLDPASTTNTITPAGIFWWYVPTGRASVQCAPVKFATSGTAYGPAVTLRSTPAIGRTVSYITAADGIGPGTASAATASLVKASDLTSYTPDGVTNQVRVKVVFSDTGSKTMGVYAVDAIFNNTKTATADAAVDVTERISSLSLSVDEEGKTLVRIATKQIAGMEDDGVEQVTITGDRPFRVALGTVDIVRGTLRPPLLTPAAGGGYGVADLLEWEGRDRGKDFEDFSFVTSVAYDGVALTTAVADIFDEVGFDSSDLLISTDAFVLPYTPGVSHGEWQLYPERGDTAALWLDKLHSDFAATWIKGWAPTLSGYTYRFLDPDDLSDTPAMTLYMSGGDAVAASVSAVLVPSRTIRAYSKWMHQAEANQIQVIGQDRRTRKVIIAQYNDAASQAPATVPASRPDNWRGKIIRYQLVDTDLITTQDAADRARDILRDRLTTTRHLIEWESDVLVRNSDDRPLWTGDVVRIYENGRATYEDYRIIAIPSMEFIQEDLSGNFINVRKATYRGERIAEGP